MLLRLLVFSASIGAQGMDAASDLRAALRARLDPDRAQVHLKPQTAVPQGGAAQECSAELLLAALATITGAYTVLEPQGDGSWLMGATDLQTVKVDRGCRRYDVRDSRPLKSETSARADQAILTAQVDALLESVGAAPEQVLRLTRDLGRAGRGSPDTPDPTPGRSFPLFRPDMWRQRRGSEVSRW